ncbi:hypothetical protein TNCV_4248531 [Trichonephila clavipes]|nr:hypothetical protein TNCV_4248531 [Trichonephila clavipes]
MATGDEKWVTYNNIVRKRSRSKCGEAAQTVAKPDLYCQQLDRLKQAIDQKARIGQQNRCCVQLGQRKGLHFCSDSPETLEA